jgi:hypothetical protein
MENRKNQTPVASCTELSVKFPLENAYRYCELAGLLFGRRLLKKQSRRGQEDPNRTAAAKPHSLDPSGPSTAALRQKADTKYNANQKLYKRFDGRLK